MYVLTQKELDLTIERVVNRLRRTDVINHTNPTSQEDRLTQKEAAELLGITVQSLIKWKKKKLIPFYQIGRSIFYSKKELLEHARKSPSIVKPSRK
jgi:excisionase family DNA binding protein